MRPLLFQRAGGSDEHLGSFDYKVQAKHSESETQKHWFVTKLLNVWATPVAARIFFHIHTIK